MRRLRFREHATNDTPQTCPACELRTDQDLVTIASSYTELATEALDAGRDGRLVAAAPIPGGNAQALRGPTVHPIRRTFSTRSANINACTPSPAHRDSYFQDATVTTSLLAPSTARQR